ncbi:hypothetical protein BKA67DRAFT_537509 [Truncatella angustata]|uniref:Uncharacterized protein n=1 Tax=Truncatella angustata TaxID=152316 RepID=A0A9P8ZW14_9PEZI|nr:uncharacterized protein BKA67DRAFT_537509 [Truncatella angustata]KAH6651647.1 hypothetical protein BKA67DRAFT_537509 [Truncatella angustata]
MSSGYRPPARVPTNSSYYSWNGTPDLSNLTGNPWMHAHHIVAQVVAAPSPTRPYPSRYGNHENQPLQSTPPLHHYPLQKSGTWSLGTSPGATGKGYGQFTMANYHAHASKE